MNHTGAHALLLDLVDGALESDREQQVREHASGCIECTSWLEAYEILSGELGSRDSTSSSHPNSREIATFALEPDSLNRFKRTGVGRHLHKCQSCAAEVQMAKVSAQEPAEARLGTGDVTVKHVPGSSRPAGIGLAAMLLLFFGVLLMTKVSGTAPREVTIDGGRVDSRKTISASRSINVKDTAVASGAALTLKSQSVAFGDGFTIEDSAALVVVTDPALRDS